MSSRQESWRSAPAPAPALQHEQCSVAAAAAATTTTPTAAAAECTGLMLKRCRRVRCLQIHIQSIGLVDRTYSKADFFGEIAVLENPAPKRAATIRVKSPAATCLQLNRDDVVRSRALVALVR